MDDSPTEQHLPDLPPSRGVPEVAPRLQADLAGLAPHAEEELGIDWGRYIAALRRYKWMIIGLTVLGTMGGVFGNRLIKPDYTTAAKIWIEPNPGRSGPIRAPELLRGPAWSELLNTWVVLDSAVIKAKLYLKHAPVDSAVFETFALQEQVSPGQYSLEITPEGRRYILRNDVTTLGSGAPGDSIGTSVGFVWTPTSQALGRNRTISFTLSTVRSAAVEVKQNLVPQVPPGGGNFLSLSYTGKDPALVPKTLNAVVDQFISVAAEQKRRKLTAQLEALEGQVEIAAADLREKENRLESFRVRTITLPNEGVPVAAGLQATQPTVMTNYFRQRLALDALQQDRKALEEALPRASSTSSIIEAFQSIPEVQDSPEMSGALGELAMEETGLRTDLFVYTEEHRVIQDRKERIRSLRSETIPQLAQALISELVIQEQALEEQLTTASRELQQIPTRTITEQRLKREMTSAEVLFQQLQNNYEQTKFALASTIPDVSLLDAAGRARPSANTSPQIWLMGFIGSLGAGVLLALLLDRLDRRVRYPDQVTRELGLTILGAIPAIRKVKAGKRDTEEASQVVEAFRTIRLNLAHSYGSAGPVLLTVSSPGPGDGKSLVSANLALSFAEAGYKTLLLDGDIRRGELHRMFGLNRQPGLLDLLTQEATLDEVLKPTTHRGLTVLPCGTRRHRGPEMLGSPPMTDLMAEVKSRFNAIVVDSPPLGAGIDPFVLGTATGHMLLVLRSGETDRQMAEAKLRLMDRLPIRMLGAVLNDIQTRSGTYRYYSYVYGYTADDEVVGQLPVGHGNGKDTEPGYEP
jgi:tyrosine-protein kinase Etk/Wzc